MPLKAGNSKETVSTNIKEFHGGRTYAHTLKKFGKNKANKQAVAVALSTARKYAGGGYARKADGGDDLEEQKQQAIGIHPVNPDAPPAPTPAPKAPPPPPMSEADLTKAYLKNLTGTETGQAGTPFKKVTSGMAQGLVDMVKEPGKLMEGPTQVQPETPGEWSDLDEQKQQWANDAYAKEMTDFGAGTATGMIGMARMPGMPKPPPGAITVGGGSPKKSPTFDPTVHPQPDEFGQPVKIKEPTPSSPPESWGKVLNDPSQVYSVGAGSPQLPPAINNIPLKPWAPEGGWANHFSANDGPVPEPAFEEHPHLQTASGAVILEPDGRMWIAAPTNKFAGVEGTFPKGKVDPGFTMQQNAIKEAYEETGFKVRLIGHVADVDKTTSRTRYYLATRETGTPAEMGWESQGLHLIPWSKAKEFLNKPVDHQVLDALKAKASQMKQPAPEAPAPKPPAAPAAVDGKYFGKYWHPYGIDPKEVQKATLVKSNHDTGGSNPGGVYHMPDGQPVYIKQFEGDNAIERTYNEVLASKLLETAGVPVAKVEMTQLKGKPAVASYMVPGKELNTVFPGDYDKLGGLREHYPAHLWTGNYDFVGTGKNNIMVMPNGQTIHIDPGGALRYRAQGKLKGPDMWGPDVQHFDLSKNYDLADVMDGHLNDPALQASAQRVADITDQQIHDLVQKYGPINKTEKPKLEEILKARRDGVAKLYGVGKGGSSPPGKATPTLTDAYGITPEQKAKAILANSKGDLYVIDSNVDTQSALYGEEYGKAVAAEIQKQIPPKPKKYTHNGMTLADPEKMAAAVLKNTEPYAKKFADLKAKYGEEYADAVLKAYNDFFKKEYEAAEAAASIHQGHEPAEYAMGDDRAPPDLTSEDFGGIGQDPWANHSLKFFEKDPWFAKNTQDQIKGMGTTPGLIEQIKKAANGEESAVRVLNNKQWQDYRPPTNENPKPIDTPNAETDPEKMGFNRFVEFHHNTKMKGKSGYLEQLVDPENKANAPGVDYADEHALYALDKPFTGYGAPTGPYLGRFNKVLELYFPNAKGETFANTGNNGEQAAPGVQKRIIAAAKDQGVDLVILHGMNDVGPANQTQYLIIDTKATLRAKDAKFNKKLLDKNSTDPLASHTLSGIAGASVVGAGLLGAQKEGDEKKMAKGGKVSPNTVLEVKRFKAGKIMIGAKEKAHRTVKKYAKGGKTPFEPKDHDFINFKKGGMIDSDIPGRSDYIPMKVSTGAYVLPADIPSALGQGNSKAGKVILDKMFTAGPYGLPLGKKGGKGTSGTKMSKMGFKDGGKIKAEKALPEDHQLGMAVPKGGSMCANCKYLASPTTCGNDGFVKWNGSENLPNPANSYCCDLYDIRAMKKADGGPTEQNGNDDHVPIIAAGGEYIIHPETVAHLGNGNMDHGHKILDKFVLHTRKEHIKTLKGLKAPK